MRRRYSCGELDDLFLGSDQLTDNNVERLDDCAIARCRTHRSQLGLGELQGHPYVIAELSRGSLPLAVRRSDNPRSGCLEFGELLLLLLLQTLVSNRQPYGSRDRVGCRRIVQSGRFVRDERNWALGVGDGEPPLLAASSLH
jgi:hypothetical protein